MLLPTVRGLGFSMPRSTLSADVLRRSPETLLFFMEKHTHKNHSAESRRLTTDRCKRIKTRLLKFGRPATPQPRGERPDALEGQGGAEGGVGGGVGAVDKRRALRTGGGAGEGGGGGEGRGSRAKTAPDISHSARGPRVKGRARHGVPPAWSGREGSAAPTMGPSRRDVAQIRYHGERWEVLVVDP